SEAFSLQLRRSSLMRISYREGRWIFIRWE
uniref:Uncharacterized protein n=1 Tax=Aegilops tauschii subsp. strangulata TaxID=200361 RepID=A0A453MPX6_AEGTS